MRHAATRGFTLPELLAVVAVIGVLAATASPMFINLMRDRRVNKATMEISGLYRLARSRAMGRGTSVMVRWDGAPKTFDVWERVVQEQEQIVVGPGCNIAWGGPDTKGVTRMTFANTSSDQLSVVDFRDGGGASAAYSEICFTPRGRTFVRYSAAAAFTPMTNVPSVKVTNQRTLLERTVFIPPNGVARMGL